MSQGRKAYPLDPHPDFAVLREVPYRLGRRLAGAAAAAGALRDDQQLQERLHAARVRDGALVAVVAHQVAQRTWRTDGNGVAG